jgi:hypothetical protein
MSDSSQASSQASSQGLSLLVGPSRDGLWIVRDAAGICGAVFSGRDDALHYAKSECEAALPRSSDWRLAPELDLTSIFSAS